MFSYQHSLKAQSTSSLEENKAKKKTTVIGHDGNSFDANAWMKGNEFLSRKQQAPDKSSQAIPQNQKVQITCDLDSNSVRPLPSGGSRSKEPTHYRNRPSKSMVLNSCAPPITSKPLPVSTRSSQGQESDEKVSRNHIPTRPTHTDAEERCHSANQRRVVHNESRVLMTNHTTTTLSNSCSSSTRSHLSSSQIVTQTTTDAPRSHGALNDIRTQHPPIEMCIKTTVSSLSSSSSSSPSTNTSSRPPTRIWKTAVDPKSGRTYYYDFHTREAQWNKPIELASDEERNAILLKEHQQHEFFTTMERNILQSMHRGELIPCVSPTRSLVSKVESTKNSTSKPMTKLVRTISSMGDELLVQLIKVENDSVKKTMDKDKPLILSLSCITDGGGRISPTGSSTSLSLSSYSSAMTTPRNEDELSDSSSSSFPGFLVPKDLSHLLHSSSLPVDRLLSPSSVTTTPWNLLTKPRLRKRNTCGTIYIGSTMAAPDKDALIRCVCGVFRAHLLNSISTTTHEGENYGSFHVCEIFNDDRSRKFTSPRHVDNTLVPTLDEVTSFYTHIFKKAQLEVNCIIMSLIYVERLIRKTHGRMRPTPKNWMSVLFACMLLSSKVWDDLSMWNVDFSRIGGIPDIAFNLKRINQLEVALLSCLQYTVTVSASEYAKYYFLLRSLTIRSGLASDELLRLMNPLDAEGAKKLDHLNQKLKNVFPKPVDCLRRSKSMGSLPSLSPASPSTKHISLEEVVYMASDCVSENQ